MPQLPLYDHQRYAFARHLDRVGVPELMWRQLKETVTSPTELFSYTPLGWSTLSRARTNAVRFSDQGSVAHWQTC